MMRTEFREGGGGCTSIKTKGAGKDIDRVQLGPDDRNITRDAPLDAHVRHACHIRRADPVSNYLLRYF